MRKRIKVVLEESTLVLALFIVSTILVGMLIWLALSFAGAWNTHAPVEILKSPNSSLTLPDNGLNEPMDIQPAGGYRLLQDTDNPQAVVSQAKTSQEARP